MTELSDKIQSYVGSLFGKENLNKFIEYISTIGKNNLIEHTPKNKENIETKNLKEEESIPIYNSKYINVSDVISVDIPLYVSKK